MAKIKEHILTTQNLTQLVQLVNEEMDASSNAYQAELDTLGTELGGLDQRLDNLYNILETGKIELDLLKPRLQELKQQHDRLLARKAELGMLLSQRRIELAGPEVVKEYVNDLRNFLDTTDLPLRKTFIKSFVKEIKITGNEARIFYNFPLPPDGHDEEELGVLPIVRYGGQ